MMSNIKYWIFDIEFISLTVEPDCGNNKVPFNMAMQISIIRYRVIYGIVTVEL
jgi:hypothetical protein